VGTSSIQLLTGHYADASLPWLATRPKFQGSIFTNQMPFLLPNQKYQTYWRDKTTLYFQY